MVNTGPTLYVPPNYLERKVKAFAYGVRDKINSHCGYERIKLSDYASLEDGDILIAMTDSHKEGLALYIKWNVEKTSLDEEVRKILNGLVDDITEEFGEVKENIKWEDR